MKLKTLKDFVLSDNEDWICTGELKAEAVKWVKSNTLSDESQMWVRQWIHSFFNLTEEDLK